MNLHNDALTVEQARAMVPPHCRLRLMTKIGKKYWYDVEGLMHHTFEGGLEYTTIGCGSDKREAHAIAKACEMAWDLVRNLEPCERKSIGLRCWLRLWLVPHDPYSGKVLVTKIESIGSGHSSMSKYSSTGPYVPDDPRPWEKGRFIRYFPPEPKTKGWGSTG